MFQIVVRGLGLPSSGTLVTLVHVCSGPIYLWKKRQSYWAKCLWGPVKGDTVDAALRGWAFNNSVRGLGNIRLVSLYSPTEHNIQPSFHWEASLIKTQSPADFICASSDRSSLLHFFLLFWCPAWSQSTFWHCGHIQRHCCASVVWPNQ